MDIAVVGAGPAGSFAAERLARTGNPVTLYDPSHPREKPCGGGVTPGVFRRYPELRELRAIGRAAPAVRLRAPGSECLRVEIPHPIDVFSRAALDGALLERALRAGVELRAARVRRVRVDRDAAWLDLDSATTRHDFVIGADGASSTVRRSLLGERPGLARGMATAGFFVEGLFETELYVEFVADWPGYLWVFPRGDHASAGICAPVGVENGLRLRERVLAMLEARYPGSLSLPRRAYGASIPCAGRGNQVAGPRFALVGDAANAVDAITGEGIQHAIDGAALLADTLANSGPLEAPSIYARRWHDGNGRELRWSAHLRARLYRPATVRLALRLAARSRRAKRVMADLLTMLQPYSGLPRRLLREAVPGPWSL
ncbi:MAG: NAD(P)/FAD-dependent oxidoreductase [Myxococcota bacterium]|nr:NAD(P)/FAD-dependent oxidoreductase [Myxococcota bacterium]